jgi:hypothetical protein
MSKWAAFNQVLEEAKNWNIKLCGAERRTVLGAISQGQRFYFPDGPDLVDTIAKAVAFKDTYQHPFDRYAILSEYQSRGITTQTMLCVSVFDPNGDDDRFLLSAAMRTRGDWMPVPAFYCRLTNNVEISPLETEYRDLFQAEVPDGMPDKMMVVAAMRVFSFLAVLGLKNTREVEVSAPVKVNRKRGKSGKRPLYSYHVLNVAGENWDSHYETGSGPGYRSHLRRGHIRRLESETVWVRATYVHGKVAGFVDKDYDLSRKAALA